VGDEFDDREALTAYLGRQISARRKGRMEDVLASRTRLLTIALEDIYQPHNASAVMRSCECFGVQDVHIIENRNEYCLNPDVDMGASHWLTLHRYRQEGIDNTAVALNALKERGYRLVATTPHRDGCALDDLPVTGPLALLFGTEELGLSAGALALADDYIHIPMCGFTESLNISVCAALALRELTRTLRVNGFQWALSDEEKAELRLAWYRRSVRGAELLEQRFFVERGR
jgi:tRNA (guanosine-2'-O-)-methyltransferase